jgi:hypothetical protein
MAALILSLCCGLRLRPNDPVVNLEVLTWHYIVWLHCDSVALVLLLSHDATLVNMRLRRLDVYHLCHILLSDSFTVLVKEARAHGH